METKQPIGTSRHGTPPHSTSQHSTSQHNTPRHNTARHSTPRHITSFHERKTMKTAIVTLKSLTPYNQSRQHFTEKLESGKEGHDDYEKRTWMEKGHYDENGIAYIPPMAFKGALAKAASMLSIPIKGKGKATYTKHFVAGIMVTDALSLGVKKADVKPQWISVSPQGKKGEMGVMRAFPHFEKWEGTIEVHVLDDTIPKDIFEQVLGEAGNFVGIGQFRPQNGGYFGRFAVESIKWK